MIKTISILGCGWYGTSLAKALIDANFNVKASTTSADKLQTLKALGASEYLVNLGEHQTQERSDFFTCDVLIISIPPKRHTGEHQAYPVKIKIIAENAKRAGVKKVIMISSTSIYGDVNKEITEKHPLSPDTDSGRAIRQAEMIIKSHTEFDSTVLRFGGLIGPGRNLGKFFAGKKAISNGLAPVNLLHLEDCVGLTMHIIKSNAFGHIFNVCSPDHPTRKKLYTLVSKCSGLEPPDFIEELLNWKLVNGNFVSSTLNYKYLVNNWSDFLSADKL
ncbi:MAG: NAD(P)H-binding protein [Bacteroidota bacterium]